MLWKRGESIITVGDQIVDKEVRLEAAENGNNLVIGPASPEDEQQYTCQISSYKPSEIVHSVKVRGESSENCQARVRSPKVQSPKSQSQDQRDLG